MGIINHNFETIHLDGVALEVEYAKDYSTDYGGYVVMEIEGVTVVDEGGDLLPLFHLTDPIEMLLTKCQEIEDSRNGRDTSDNDSD